jgi:hypothetical protein
VSGNQKAAEKFVQNFVTVLKANGFISKQVFNCDENGVFWGKNGNHPRGGSITGIETNEGQTDCFALWKWKWGLRSIDRIIAGKTIPILIHIIATIPIATY